MKTTLLIFFLAIGLLSLSAETVPQTQSTLDSYFTTGSLPTQNDYDELIDTMFWYINSTYTNSQAAASNATVAAQNNPVNCSAVLLFTNQTPFFYGLTLRGVTNLAATATSGSSGWTFTISNNFMTPMPDTNYVFTGLGNGTSITNFFFKSVTTTNCVIEFDSPVSRLASHLAIQAGFFITR